MTKNGSGSLRVSPSCDTCRSSIASSSALCVLGGARLISSASTTALKIGPGVEAEHLRRAVEDRHAEHVRRQEVARELDARVAQAERGRERVGEGRLADARDVLDQQVAAREEARERELDRAFLADDDARELRERGGEPRRGGHAGRGRADGHGEVGDG